MKVAFIVRSTLYSVPGGDTIQIRETAKHLNQLGAQIDIHLTNKKINYKNYDLFHFFNLIRPADILYHLNKINQAFVISPILVDYSEYDKIHRKGISGSIFRKLSPAAIEYFKTISRWLLRKDSLRSKSYIWKGHTKAIKQILQKASIVLPNSSSEYKRLKELYGISKPYEVIPNGIDTEIFRPEKEFVKDNKLILCAARIEGRKNQLNLIHALANTEFTLLLIGAAAPNQKRYYRHCRQAAAENIHFIQAMPQEQLISYYKKCKVHVLPSWFETCGLSSLEAASLGCNIVITEKGFTRDYFGDQAVYCEPEDTHSIHSAVKQAAESKPQLELQEKIFGHYTWMNAAKITFEVYKKIMPSY